MTTIQCLDPVQAHKAWATTGWPQLKANLTAGQKMEVIIRPLKRSTQANARLHAMLGWLSKHVQWAGEYRSIDHWRRLTTAAWLRAKGESVEYLPALDGHGIDVVFAKTSEMSGKQISELMEWIEFWAADMGHDLPDYQRDPQTGQMVAVTKAKP